MTERLQTLVQLSNTLAIGDDGWAMLAPYGDHPGVAFTPAGRRDAIQRVDRESGEALRRSLLSFTGKAARFFRSVPIFNGHPDVSAVADRFPDSEVKGHVGDLQIREDGIYVRPVLNESGAQLLNAGERLGLSAYVDARVLGEEDGKLVAQWSALKSVGMTPHPNLPVELLNSIEGGDSGGQRNPQDPTMNQAALIAALGAAGIQIANAATEDQVLAGIRALHERATAAVTAANAKDGEITALKTERDGLKTRATDLTTQLANEQDARRKDLLDERVASGAIAEADRALWDGRLKANFANEASSLRSLTPKIKVASAMHGAGSRRGSDTDPGTSEAYLANVREAVKAGKSMAAAVRDTIVTIPNSYAAWREAGCPAI
jgi:hypothetical protein